MRASRDIFKLIARRISDTLLYVKTVRGGVRSIPRRAHGLPGKLVVSLTSYPKRYATLRATLVSILNQSIQPDEVVLWIATGDMQSLPSSVLNLRENGLRIAACDDIRSYKKIIPSLLEDSDRFIVTADDDVYYEEDWLKTLVQAYSGEKVVLAHRVHRVRLLADGQPAPYLSWHHNHDGRVPDGLNFATGIGGILYPPGALHSDVVDRRTFQSICPYGDDIWLYWMARRNGYEIASVGTPRSFRSWPGSQLFGLHRINALQADNMNDQQIAAMIAKYDWPG